MIYTIFEDKDYNSLYPLNINRLSCELRCGAFTNLERIINSIELNDTINIVCRDELAPIFREKYPKFNINPDIISGGIWLNGRALWNRKKISNLVLNRTYSNNGFVMGLSVQESINRLDMFSFLENANSVSTELEIDFFNYVWDGIFFQSNVINSDAEFFINLNNGKIHPSVVFENAENIFISEKAEIRVGAILDASKGPIIILDDSIVDSGAIIQGPAYIGTNCIINPGAKLRGNISLGNMCKVGGEIEDAIFQGYSNKQHDGFLGHSYIGEWVNLGANTNNSDLKNNYGVIKIYLKDEFVETGRQFLGTMVGDYSRTGISTMLNTGTIIGFGANIFGGGFQEKNILSFQWGTNDKTDLEKFLVTVEKIKKRRKKSITGEEIKFITQLYNKQNFL